MTVSAIAVPTFDPGGINAQKTVNRVKVMMTEGKHDTAIITLRGESTDAPELQPGTPVSMQYGWSSIDTDWFYGYVDHLESRYDRAVTDPATFEDVVCLGASYTLKDPFLGAWSNAQASAIVQQIATKYFLSTIIEDDDTVWPQLSSPGLSAWAYLVQLANKVGYSLSCNKTALRFVSVDLAMRQYAASIPVFNTRNTAPNYLLQGVSRFQALTGEALALPGHTKAVRSVSGINLQSGEIIGAVNNGTHINPLGQNVVHPFFGEQVSDTVVSSQADAQAALSGMAQTNRFAYQATATLSGLTAVRQGTPVVIAGVDSNNDGTWWVQEVTHKIVSQGYSMDVCLGRDSVGDTGLRPVQGTSVVYTSANPYAYAMTNVPPTQLLNSRWRAAYQSSVDIN